MDVSINMLNLKYFANHNNYNKLFNQNNNDNDILLYSAKDYKFYKKRILQLAKNILRKKEKDTIIVEAFDEFIHVAINHLKFIDKSDILQTEFSLLAQNDIKDDLQSNLPIIYENETDKLVNEDKLLFKQNKVQSIKIDECFGIKRKLREPPFIPKQKHINLKERSLKNKGIPKNKNRHKKKTINT